jgi:hypothetical protein
MTVGEAIELEVRERANSRTSEVIAAAVRQLVFPSHCSYAAHIVEYSKLRKAHKRLLRDQRRAWSNYRTYSYSDHQLQIERARNRMIQLRAELYRSPCKSCHHCSKRRRSWPSTSTQV